MFKLITKYLFMCPLNNIKFYCWLKVHTAGTKQEF